MNPLWYIGLLVILSFAVPSSSAGSLPEIDIKETEFESASDYASWLQYLGEQLVRAGDWSRLDQTAYILKALLPQLPRQERDTIRKIVTKFRGQSSRLKGDNDPMLSKTDPAAERIFEFLLKGRHLDARDEIRAIVGGDIGKVAKMSPPLKNLLITTGLILYDGLNPYAILPLWSHSWGLNLDQKLAALVRARELKHLVKKGDANPHSKPAFRPFPRMNLVDARVLANLGRNVSNQFNEPFLKSDPVERKLLEISTLYAQGKQCEALQHIYQILPIIRNKSKRDYFDQVKGRLESVCGLSQTTQTYKSFCQTSPKAFLPIAEAVTDTKLSSKVMQSEKLFWVYVWIGDCQGALMEFNNLKMVLPAQLFQKAPHLRDRLGYMSERVKFCSPTTNLYLNPIDRQLIVQLQRGDFIQAEQLWQQAYQRNPNDQVAKLLKTAIIIMRFPRAIYAPCTGNKLLTGDSNNDMAIIHRIERLLRGEKAAACDSNSLAKSNVQWMKAAFIIGNWSLARQFAEKTAGVSGYCNEADELMACLSLCPAGAGKSGACQALTYYSRLCPKSAQEAHARLGRELADQMCKENPGQIRDPFYIKYGPTPRPLSSLMDRYYPGYLKKSRPRLKFNPVTMIPQSSSRGTRRALIDLPPRLRKLALQQAKDLLCPCQAQKTTIRTKSEARMQKEEKAHMKPCKLSGCKQDCLYQAFRRFLKLHPHRCHCHLHKNVRIPEATLAKSGALRAAALILAKSKTNRCPCFNKHLMHKYRIKIKKKKRHHRIVQKCQICKAKCNCPQLREIRKLRAELKAVIATQKKSTCRKCINVTKGHMIKRKERSGYGLFKKKRIVRKNHRKSKKRTSRKKKRTMQRKRRYKKRHARPACRCPPVLRYDCKGQMNPPVAMQRPCINTQVPMANLNRALIPATNLDQNRSMRRHEGGNWKRKGGYGRGMGRWVRKGGYGRGHGRWIHRHERGGRWIHKGGYGRGGGQWSRSRGSSYLNGQGQGGGRWMAKHRLGHGSSWAGWRGQMTQGSGHTHRRRLVPCRRIHGIGCVTHRQMNRIACHVRRCPDRCVQSMLRRFPFLVHFIKNPHAELPCMQMTKRMKHLFARMIRTLEDDCASAQPLLRSITTR